MAGKFHINSKGEPGACSAQRGGCPFGGEIDHYATKEGASAAYERSMTDGILPKLSKAPTREQVLQTLDNMDRGSNAIPEEIEFVGVEPNVTSQPATPVETLQTAIQDEIEWAAGARAEAQRELDAVVESTNRIAEKEGIESEAYSLAADNEIRFYSKLKEIEEYQRDLARDSVKLKSQSDHKYGITEMRETLRERHLKKKLHDLQYESSDGNPSLKELEDKVDWPIRQRDESHPDYQARLEKAGSQESENSVLLSQKHAEESRIKAELDEAEKKRLYSGLPEGKVKRNARVDTVMRKNAVLFGQDEENLANYNSFANRASRLFKKRNVLTDRNRLDALPAGRKLIDYDPTDKKETVWTKTGHNSWVSESGIVSTDDERKLPATIVE